MTYLREIINNYLTPRFLRSSNKKLLAEPRIRSKAYNKRTFDLLPHPYEFRLVRKLDDLTQLVCLKKLKTQLFETVFKIEEV